MTSRRQIMIKAGRAVMNSAAVLAFCKEHFGRGIEVHVGAYAQGIPGKDDAPYLWIYAAPSENESVRSDETFTVHFEVGACVVGPDGEKKIGIVEQGRTAGTNGMVINGGNETVESLRDMIAGIVRGTKAGAIVAKIRRTENDIEHYPLEWAEFEVDYEELESLENVGG